MTLIDDRRARVSEAWAIRTTQHTGPYQETEEVIMKLGKRTIAATALLAITCTSAIAWAHIPYHFLSEKATHTAGRETGQKTTVGGFGDYQGIFRVDMWERGDDPCHLKTTSRHLNTFRSRAGHYGPTTCNNSRRTIEFRDRNTFVSGVRVCLNEPLYGGPVGKIKGLQVRARRLDRATGQLSAVPERQWQRANCRFWSGWKECVPGKVATELRVSHTSGYASGIQLVCASPVKQ